MNDLTAALLLWLSLTATAVRADSRAPRFSASDLRSSDRPPQARPPQPNGTGYAFKYDGYTNHTTANHTSSIAVSTSAFPVHSLYTSPSPVSEGSPSQPSPQLGSDAISTTSTSSVSSPPSGSNSSLQRNSTIHSPYSGPSANNNLTHASSTRNNTHSASSAPTYHESQPSSAHTPISLASTYRPVVPSNSSSPGYPAYAPGTAHISASPAASLYPSNSANTTRPATAPLQTGIANGTRMNFAVSGHNVTNATTPAPSGPRPTCHPSYVAALNSGLDTLQKANVSDELCDACPKTAEVLQYVSVPAPGVDRLGHDYASSCNDAWLQYSTRSSMWWELVGSKSTHHHPVSTWSTSRVLGYAAEPTVLSDGFTRMKGPSSRPGAWVPTATEKVRTERLPPPTTSTTYHKACLSPDQRGSHNVSTSFPNARPQCQIGPVQCKNLNKKHGLVQEEDLEGGWQHPVCGKKAFKYSTCSIYASKVQIFYWPDATDVHRPHASTTPAPVPTPRSIVTNGQTMVSPYVYLSLEHIGLAKTWIVDFTSRSAATDLPGATNTLLKLKPEALSTVVYTVPHCKGLCADHLQSIFSTAPSAGPQHHLRFTAQPYNPATVNHSEPVPASAYFWGRVDAGYNMGRVPLTQLYYHPEQQVIWDDYLPQIAVPNDIRKLGPNGTWEGCGLGIGGIYDPPIALGAASTQAAPDITPPGGAQPTSTPASPASGSPQVPAPTGFGGPEIPVLTPTYGGPSVPQSSSTPASKPAENGFGNPLAPAGSPDAPSDPSGPPPPPSQTSFGESATGSLQTSMPSVLAEASSTVSEAPAPASLPVLPSTSTPEFATASTSTSSEYQSTGKMSDTVAQSPSPSSSGSVGVVFNPDSAPTSNGLSSPSAINSLGSSSQSPSDTSSDGQSTASDVSYTPGTNSAVTDNTLINSDSSDFPGSIYSSVVEGAVAAVSFPAVAVPSTPAPSELDAALDRTASSLSASSEDLPQHSALTTGTTDIPSNDPYTDGKVANSAGRISVAPVDTASSAPAPATNVFTDPIATEAPDASSLFDGPSSATSTQALATHTLIKNIFGDVVATAAVVAGTTLVASGPPATINGNTVSLAPDGLALVVNGATTASFPTTAGQPRHTTVNSATVYAATVTGSNSATTAGAVLYGTTLVAGGPSLVYSSHTYSVETRGNVLVDGSRTIHIQPTTTSSSTSAPLRSSSPAKASGAQTTAVMTLGPSKTLSATQTAQTDANGKTHDVVCVGSQTATVGQTITAAGVAVTVQSTGLVYHGTTATFSTSVTNPSSNATKSISSPTPESSMGSHNSGLSSNGTTSPSTSLLVNPNTASPTGPHNLGLLTTIVPAVLGMAIILF